MIVIYDNCKYNSYLRAMLKYSDLNLIVVSKKMLRRVRGSNCDVIFIFN